MKKTNENVTKIIQLLNDGQFHDGTSIGHQLNMTRSAVWKIIKKLEKYNIPIQSIKGKGYALLDPLILLDHNKIKKMLKTTPIDINIFEQIDSTNNYLASHCNDSKLKVCIAETQTHGKGRLHRQWHSPFGQNIYLSLLYPFNKDISELAGLSLVVGLSICKAIETLYSLTKPALIKWPNDIICQNKKLAGNLIEIKAEAHGFCYAIIGIGINVNMTEDPNNDINQAWTSIRQLTNQYNDRNLLCVELIDQLTAHINQFEKKGLNHFLLQWQSKDGLANKTIHLQSGRHKFQGTALGINEQGHLLMKLADGSQREFSSGDTTLLKPKNA